MSNNNRIDLHIIFTLILAASGFLGCTTLPSTHVTNIIKSTDNLYVVTKEGLIKSFKVKDDSYTLVDGMKFPDMDYGRNITSPTIRNIFKDKQDIMIDAYQANAFPENTNIYIVENRTIEKLGSLPYSTYLVAADARYLYGIESKSIIVNDRTSTLNKNVRYDAQLDTKIADHFDDRQLTVIHSWDDINVYWYVCTDVDSVAGAQVAGKVASIKRVILLSVDKQSGEFQEFKIDEQLPLCHVSDEVDSIWFFGIGDSGTELVRFLKDSKRYSTYKIPTRIMPFPHNAFSKPSSFIWAISLSTTGRNIYRIDKNDLSMRTIPMPDGITIDTFLDPIYSDDDTVWIGATKHRNLPPFMNDVPYIVKIRKTDLNVQLVLVKPTVGEAIGAIFESFINWFLIPFAGKT